MKDLHPLARDRRGVPELSRFHALLYFAGAAVAIFLSLQLVRPKLTNPPVIAELRTPPEVNRILRSSCYDCHSNETKLRWFDRVIPAYWLVASDVKKARNHLNFSSIGAQPAAKQKAALYEAVNQIQLGAMPPPSYRAMHPDSAASGIQIGTLMRYLDPTPVSAVIAAKERAAADLQYFRWIEKGAPLRNVQNEPNGVAFLPDYKNWKAISSTDRFDNHTMRIILANDVATRAIAENHINPWPDGATFAKAAWRQQTNATGFTQTGAFVQVEFMIKDKGKYASTAGWGWGRWLGVELKPYGDGPDFTDECVSCHTPVRGNDYVYTMPIGGQQ